MGSINYSLRKVLARSIAIVFFSLCFIPPLSAGKSLQELTILVPAERSGGWDLTAQALATALQQAGIVETVKINYSPGAGGLIGLAQFISLQAGKGDTLLVGGMFTVGAAIQHRSTVSLLDTTPVARLAFDNVAIAVPSNSKFMTAGDLLEAWLSAPESVFWVGGSKGGGDEVNMHEIARALGIAPSRLRYTGLTGGGEVGSALVLGRYQVGISGYSEFEALVESGRLKVLAIASMEPGAKIAAPTFKSLGISVERFNWRGVFAPPDIDQAQLEALESVMDRLVRSQQWQDQLLKHHWQDGYLPGKDFIKFVEAEQEALAVDLVAMKAVNSVNSKVISSILLRRYTWAIVLAGVIMLLVLGLLWQHRQAQKREAGLQQAYEAATGQALLQVEALERALTDIQSNIEQEFDRWNLTTAEREVALLMLKGLRFQDIAGSRGTSERTVRQQAQAVYRKAALDGRLELAAYFIEDVIHSMQVAEHRVN